MWDFISLYYANMIRMVFMHYVEYLPDVQVAKEKYLTEFEENRIFAGCYLCDAHQKDCDECELAKKYKTCMTCDSPYNKLFELISVFNCSKDSVIADVIIETIDTIRDCCK